MNSLQGSSETGACAGAGAGVGAGGSAEGTWAGSSIKTVGDSMSTVAVVDVVALSNPNKSTSGAAVTACETCGILAADATGLGLGADAARVALGIAKDAG